MKLAIAVAVLLGGASLARAEESRLHLQDVPRELEHGGMVRRDERTGSFEIDIDTLEPIEGETAAKIRVKNDFALEEVELTCSAFDEREQEISQRSWRLKESGVGKMEPGESVAVTLRFGAPPAVVRSTSCNARGW